ncbi:MAG: RluA family pseudouridine synthase [Eubacteriales bacterium]|nr:RluA family pseudouridine synthase [Eubacteriales bacterium]
MDSILEKLEVNITCENEGTRLDLVLSAALEDYSRTYIQKLFEKGNISLDGRICTEKKHKCKVGEKVSITIPMPKRLEVEPEDIPLDIVFEDEDLLVVNKPPGMVVHPAPGNYSGTLVNALMHHCGDDLSSINGIIRPGIVHRIDKDTSGLLVVAKTDVAHVGLSKQLADHSISRKYNAIVYSNIKDDEGTVDQPIGRDPGNRLRNKVLHEGMQGFQSAKSAITHYKVLERFGDFTLIEAVLETGRTHQIRVHMAYIRHPLLGDELYGPSKNRQGAKRQMLHARVLGFVHPVTGHYMEFETQIPEDFEKVLRKIRGA